MHCRKRSKKCPVSGEMLCCSVSIFFLELILTVVLYQVTLSHTLAVVFPFSWAIHPPLFKHFWVNWSWKLFPMLIWHFMKPQIFTKWEATNSQFIIIMTLIVMYFTRKLSAIQVVINFTTHHGIIRTRTYEHQICFLHFLFFLLLMNSTTVHSHFRSFAHIYNFTRNFNIILFMQ